jgi:hypothetical protein
LASLLDRMARVPGVFFLVLGTVSREMTLSSLKTGKKNREEKKETITKRSRQLEDLRNGVIASVGFPTVMSTHKEHSLHHICTFGFRLRGVEWIVLCASLVTPPKTRYKSNK